MSNINPEPQLETFSIFGHLESTVDAIQLTPETQYDVVTVLGTEAEDGKLLKLFIDTDDAAGCYTFQYRYKDDSTESKLTPGNYIVRLNAGKYIVRNADEFEQEYIPVYKDHDLLPTTPLSPSEAMLQILQTKFPDDGYESLDDLTSADLTKIVESYEGNYDALENRFTIDFTDCAMVDPTGLADIVCMFPEASFIQKDTTFILNFNNGAPNRPKNQQNIFNYAALQTLAGELRRIDYRVASRIVGITFQSADRKAPSAVAPSVTEDQWNAVCAALMAVTGIEARLDIKR